MRHLRGIGIAVVIIGVAAAVIGGLLAGGSEDVFEAIIGGLVALIGGLLAGIGGRIIVIWKER